MDFISVKIPAQPAKPGLTKGAIPPAPVMLKFTMKGFTLIETIMVMVVTLILAAVVIMRWGASDTVRLDGAVRKISADIRYAQKLSVSSQSRAGVLFNPNGYGVYALLNSGVITNSPGDPCSTDSAGKFVVDFTQARCSDYSGVTVTPPASNPLAFDSIGAPIDNATGAALASNQTVTVNYKGAKSIVVEAATGRVSY